MDRVGGPIGLGRASVANGEFSSRDGSLERSVVI